MASSTEDYGSELQELQWSGSGSSHLLRSSNHFARTGGVCYEAEDLARGSTQQHQHRGYYSPPGTSYTIVERPPSHHHSSHTTPYRHSRAHTNASSAGAISPEQVIRMFGTLSSDRKPPDRRTPASSPASVSAMRSTPTQQSQTHPQTSPIGPQPLSLQELTVRTITMTREPPDSHHGFGICVKGGKDAGVGVYISRVEEGSVAERAGLRPGDTILEVNGTPFRAVTHEDALKMLKSCRTLSMTVRGPALDPRCRGSHPTWVSGGSGRQQSCSWMDRQGRPVSPPRDSRFGPRTRKVELCIEPGQSLGLMIRGGLEYGLGIYVTGVDKDSVADRAGLMVGDQIIEVNGQSFEEATHDEAVQILKTNKRMSLVIRDVGKVPHSCTTSQPIVLPGAAPAASRYPEHDTLLESPSNRHHRPPSPSSSITCSADWRHRGIQSVSAATMAMVEEKARVVLARSERAALSQLLADYRTRRISVEDLVTRLADLLNTHEKLTLLTELRELVDSKDRASFDELVYRPRVPSARSQECKQMDLIVSPSIHQLSRGCSRPGRLMDVEGDPLGVTGPLLLPKESHEYRSPSEDSGFGSDMLPKIIRGTYRRGQQQVATSDLTLSNDDECDNQDYDENNVNERGRRHSSPGNNNGNRDYAHHHIYSDNLENDGGCDGSDAEMIGNGRRGDRDRDTEDDADDAEREDDAGEEGASGGGFGAWRNHLLGGITQRVKSWYWGSSPLEGQLLDDGGCSGSDRSASGGLSRRHHSAQRLGRNDQIADRREEDAALVVPDHQGNLRITVKKTKSILGIAIEGGANTKHPLPRIINIHDDGAAFEAGGLEVGQLILEVDGQKVDGLHHQEVARLIADSFARRDRNEIEFLVVEAKKSNLEPKPTALIFLEA